MLTDFLPEHLVRSLSAAVAILTSMITPALLISACGTFILSTSNRLGRVVDRVRVLSDNMENLMGAGTETQMLDERRSIIFKQMDQLSNRATLLARSLTIFYLAAATFVATSVAIGLVSIFKQELAWIPVTLGMLGACFLFYGSIILILEARLAVGTLRSEMSFLGKLVNFHYTAHIRVNGKD
ncbi:MAG: DUF2721 domain-containing protein [Bryobacteraceae bacterium]